MSLRPTPHQAIISPAQIKAGRAILGWYQGDLAREAGVSLNTISNLESGFMSPRSARRVRHALEEAGLEFLPDDGVKRSCKEINIYRGSHSGQTLYEDVLRGVRLRDDSILCVVHSYQMLIDILGSGDHKGEQRLAHLCDMATMKCLFLIEPHADAVLPSGLECRLIKEHLLGAGYYFVYGDAYAHAQIESGNLYSFVRWRIPHNANNYRNDFIKAWGGAVRLFAQQSQQPARRRVSNGSHR